jgi:hypothetical protein
MVNSKEDYLVGLSLEELQALAAGMLVPTKQAQLKELLDRNAEGQASSDEMATLDSLLSQIDQLNILKTRARSKYRTKVLGSVGSAVDYR